MMPAMKHFTLLCCLLCAAQIFSQNTTAKADTLRAEEAVRLALENNYDIRLSQADADIARLNNTRANAGMSACFARPDTLALAGSTAMTDRRDDDFRIRPSAPKNRGQGFVSKVLKQAGKASGGGEGGGRETGGAATFASW